MHKEEKLWSSVKTSLLQARWHCLGKLSPNFSFQTAAKLFSVCIQHSNSGTQPNTASSVTSLHGTYLTYWFYFIVLLLSLLHFHIFIFLFMLLLFSCLLPVCGNSHPNSANPTIAQDIAYLLLCNITIRSWSDCPPWRQCNKNQIQQCST